MHEIGIAQQIAQKVIDEAAKANSRVVVGVEVEVGDFAFLDTESLSMWLRQALEDSAATAGASVSISVVSSTLTCAACGFQGPPDLPVDHDHHLPPPPASCPRCASPNVQIDAQRDCVLKRVELQV